MHDHAASNDDAIFIAYEDSLARVRVMTEYPDEFSPTEHSAVANELAAAFEVLTTIELVTSEQLAPFVTESGLALRRHERAVHPEYAEAYGTLQEILKRMADAA